jgi:hypothetical protein
MGYFVIGITLAKISINSVDDAPIKNAKQKNVRVKSDVFAVTL